MQNHRLEGKKGIGGPGAYPYVFLKLRLMAHLGISGVAS